MLSMNKIISLARYQDKKFHSPVKKPIIVEIEKKKLKRVTQKTLFPFMSKNISPFALIAEKPIW